MDRGLNKLWELKIETEFIKPFYHEHLWNDLLIPTCLGIIHGGLLTKNVNFNFIFLTWRDSGLVGLVLLFLERVEFV